MNYFLNCTKFEMSGYRSYGRYTAYRQTVAFASRIYRNECFVKNSTLLIRIGQSNMYMFMLKKEKKMND